MLDELVGRGGYYTDPPFYNEIGAWKGIVGKYYYELTKMVAISPLVLDELRSALNRLKNSLINDPKNKNLRSKVSLALSRLRDKFWPECEIYYINEEVWRIESVNNPPLYVIVAPWILSSYFKEHGHVMLFLTNQPIPYFEKVIYSYRSHPAHTIHLVIPLKEGELFTKTYGKEHPMVKHILDELNELTVSEHVAIEQDNASVEQVQGLKVSEQAPTTTATTTPPSSVSTYLPHPSPLQDTPSISHVPIHTSVPEPFIILGAERPTGQWGVIGRTSDGSNVLLDLNAPHIIFVCGKMGAGKGYTIGVICEMLCSTSIPNISNVSKRATIIVFHKPKEDVRSEFWSFPYSNYVESEVDVLERKYGVKPTNLLKEEELRVFVDPHVYEKSKDKFIREYKTNNIYPLKIDPSTLTGEEWAIALSAGSSESLYVKRLFRIIEELQQGFTIEELREMVSSDPDLNMNQKKLADMRIDMLAGYFVNEKERGSDIGSRLAVGGVNIIDLRKTIRQPTDDFAVMTLILSILQSKQGLEDEPFVFVFNEAHTYFKRGLSSEFVDAIEYLIRRKRHKGNWLLLDTHDPDDVEPNVIKLSDIKILYNVDKTALTNTILTRAFEGARKPYYELKVGEALISADKSSEGSFIPVVVSIRPRIILHGAPTRTAV